MAKKMGIHFLQSKRARTLIGWNIDSISVNPSSLVTLLRIAAKAEQGL